MKYIFDKTKIQNKQLNTNNFLGILNDDENEKIIFKKYETVAFSTQNNFDMNTIYYDEETNEIKKKNKVQLFKEGTYQLEEGEIFHEDTQEFTTIEQPSKWHTWNGKTWEVDIEEVKKIKRFELKRIREQKISENIEVHGFVFQVREKDLENFEDVAIAILRKKKTEEDTRAWILADNSIKVFTYAQLLDVLDERALRKEKIFDEYGTLIIKLQQAKTLEEIENIKF